MSNKCYIIDTNIIIAANGETDHLTKPEKDKCKQFIASLFNNSIISFDLQGEIFYEYFKYVNRSGQPNIGDVFVKYLWDRQNNSNHCEKVDIERNKKGIYKQFNKKEDLLDFDSNDQKFIAVHIGSKKNPVICNASDSDWENSKALLMKYNINVLEILKEENIC